jgi:hypothetical protein
MGNRVVVTLRAHRRPQLLDKVLRYYIDLNTSRVPVDISLLTDRPSKEVREVIDVHSSHIKQINECPFPIVSFEGGNQFPRAAQHQYELISGLRPDFVIFGDDDRWFSGGFRQELWRAVGEDHIDLWYAKSLFFWEPNKIRTDFCTHNSPAMYRYSPGDCFDPKRHLQAPVGVHDRARREGRYRQLESVLLDHGYCGQEERRRLLRVFKDCGRLDKFTMHLLDENPELIEWQG